MTVAMPFMEFCRDFCPLLALGLAAAWVMIDDMEP